jgi:hypothetical protein
MTTLITKPFKPKRVPIRREIAAPAAPVKRSPQALPPYVFVCWRRRADGTTFLSVDLSIDDKSHARGESSRRIPGLIGRYDLIGRSFAGVETMTGGKS